MDHRPENGSREEVRTSGAGLVATALSLAPRLPFPGDQALPSSAQSDGFPHRCGAGFSWVPWGVACGAPFPGTAHTCSPGCEASSLWDIGLDPG